MPLTQQQFAQCCAYIARHASAWAGDTLEIEGDLSPETAARFTDQLRERADRIDQRTGRQASPAPAAPQTVCDEDRAEQFIQAAVDSAPEPLRRLGEWLANKLDDDDWKTADRLITGAAVSLARATTPSPDMERWLPIATALKDGSEFIARTGPGWPSFSCFWDRASNAFVHYDHDEGYIQYPVTEWQKFPAPERPDTAEPAMPTARAFAIVGAICERSFHTMGMAELLGDLHGVSLAEMIEAKRVIEAENDKPPIGGTRTIHCVPDDRLIAAAYALANYEPRHGAVVSEPNGDGLVKALAIVRLTAAPPVGGHHGPT